MNNLEEPENRNTLPFTEDYWKEEGGHKWVEHIDATESSLEAFNEILLEQAFINDGEWVLDVGCGGGMNSMEIAQRVGPGGWVRGLDISGPILKIARSRGEGYSNLEFIEGDAARVSLEEDNYDLIFSRFGVMFFSDPVAAFTNLRNSLKSTGRMVFLCWRSLQENPWMSIPAQAVSSVVEPQGPAPDPTAPGPFSLAESSRIEELLTSAGLKIIDLRTVDVVMRLGPMSETVEYFLKMGPAAAALADAGEELKKAAAEALRHALEQFESNGTVNPPAAAWIVNAEK